MACCSRQFVNMHGTSVITQEHEKEDNLSGIMIISGSCNDAFSDGWQLTLPRCYAHIPIIGH